MMVVVVPLGLLDLGEGLLGGRKVTALQGGGEGAHRILGGTPLPVRCSGTLSLRGGTLGSICLEGRERLLGAREVAALQGLAELIPQALHLSPLALLGRTDRTGCRRNTKV